MDSDIFAVAPLAGRVRRELEDCDILTGCQPLWSLIAPAARGGFMGRHLTTPDGNDVGSSYFCVYPTALAQSLSKDFDVGFEGRSRKEVPSSVQVVLRGYGWSGERLDTGKILNILALSRKKRVSYTSFPEILHIGGISRYFLRERREEWAKPFELNNRTLGSSKPGTDTRPHEERLAHRQRRRGIARYFAEFLMFLEGEGPKPLLSITDRKLAERMALLCSRLERLS